MKTLISTITLLLITTISFAADANKAGQTAAPKPENQTFTNVPGAWGKFDSTVVGAMKQATAGRDEDPLKYLAMDMGEIVTDLEAYHTGEPTQAKQAKVVDRLDTLIAMLEKQCSGSGNRSGANPTKPLDHAKIMGGPGGGTMNSIKEGDKNWANLPAKQRDQILQSKTEGFPQGYESILQSYYKRLSQQSADEATNSPAPTTAPSK